MGLHLQPARSAPFLVAKVDISDSPNIPNNSNNATALSTVTYLKRSP